jgi:hypothetical protein
MTHLDHILVAELIRQLFGDVSKIIFGYTPIKDFMSPEIKFILSKLEWECTNITLSIPYEQIKVMAYFNRPKLQRMLSLKLIWKRRAYYACRNYNNCGNNEITDYSYGLLSECHICRKKYDNTYYHTYDYDKMVELTQVSYEIFYKKIYDVFGELSPEAILWLYDENIMIQRVNNQKSYVYTPTLKY